MQLHVRALSRRSIAAVGFSLIRLAHTIAGDGGRADPVGGMIIAGGRRLARASLTELENDILRSVAEQHQRVSARSGNGPVVDDRGHGVASDPRPVLLAASSCVEHYCQRLAEKGLLDLVYPHGYRLTRIGRALATPE